MPAPRNFSNQTHYSGIRSEFPALMGLSKSTAIPRSGRFTLRTTALIIGRTRVKNFFAGAG